MQNNENAPLAHKPNTNRYVPKTPFEKKMAALRAEIVASGAPLLDLECIAKEVAERRGGVGDAHLS